MNQTFQCDGSTALVKTSKGQIKGYEHNGLSVFKGIPYGKAKRFHAPEPAEKWDGVFDAASYGFVCPLLSNERPGGELYVPHRYWPMDEDCLNLNIWTPGLDDGKRPVLVWLHGGGYEAGSAIEQVAYDGANMARLGDAVVVSVNHRLNILGYFDLSDFGEEYVNSANAGTDDIIAALQWVHDNIAVFGGDPGNVTVFGQSGGGAKVTTLLQTPAADGLYAKGINMSGVIGLLADEKGSGKELAEALMRALGLSSVKELETVDYRLLAKAYLKLRPVFQKAGKYVGCKPHPNAFYAGDPAAVGFRQETARIPLMVGSVFSEFFSFAPSPYDQAAMTPAQQEKTLRETLGDEGADALIPLFQKAYPERSILDLLRLDFVFRGPEIDYIAKRSALNGSTFSYLFNLDQPINGGTTPWHCSDIPYVFHNIDLVEHTHRPDGDNAVAERVQEQVFDSVMAFARTGNPANDRLPDWQPCGAGCENTMVIGEACGVRQNFDHALLPALVKYLGPVIARQMARKSANIQH
ncbi:MAG: carboxylesterase/lipase family protein [Clostridia bacterium]|nr:carboxylesterase/lipase family protein [Clostridia bacterium]